MTGRRPAAWTLRTACVAIVALGLAGQALAQNPPLRLLLWINGDKGFKGLQRVGDAFAALSGVQVVVTG